MEVLQLDMSGRPQSWISAKEAAVIYASDGVAWTLGEAGTTPMAVYLAEQGKSVVEDEAAT